MRKSLIAVTLAAGLGAASFSQQAAADPLAGAIVGGVIGGAVGGPPGAAVGAILGTAIGAQPYYYAPYYGSYYYGRPYYGRYYAPYAPAYYAPRYYAPAYAPAYYAPPVRYYSQALERSGRSGTGTRRPMSSSVSPRRPGRPAMRGKLSFSPSVRVSRLCVGRR